MPRTSHSQRIHEDFLNRIQRGEVRPSDRLVDTTIAAELGVSRMPVREALQKLAHQGYLVGTSRGFKLPDLTRSEVMDVFEIRRLLEPRAAASVTKSLDEATLGRMRQAVADAASTLETGDISVFFRASEEFRNGWLESVPNAALCEAIKRNLIQVQAVRLATMRDPSAHAVIVQGQRTLFRAFERRDALSVHDNMLSFVIMAEQAFERLVPEASPDGSASEP